MYVSFQTIVTAAAVVAAVLTLIKYYNTAYKWYQKQGKQDEDITAIKAEQGILTYGVLACLKGLAEQGCDGPVHDAIQRIEKHLNETAHK